ncbi:glycosyltransferase family 8 protein [Enterococcus alishanensis]|uniref:Glycosyltransferase family 8 protein n=1 Tax=Enterococcus alishanensis TaxID=1303817 RepID=A0ABS6TGA0_9ENTE|nr:glycosyltransferase family 8 protein [Enterococcus alishanensis]MBV7391903.1 glycosyltransferase family 8 protein [Enterococcus alishanensis]
MDKHERVIVASTNSDFAPHLAALFVSILDQVQSSKDFFHFYVIDDELDFNNRQLLRLSVKNYCNHATVDFMKIDPKFFENVVVSERIPKTAYYRIAIPELFRGTGIDRILYLDCDMIVLDDITKLWQLKLDDTILAAVEDAGFHNRLAKMQIPTLSDRYFNSGFMFINIKQWLKNEVTSKVLNFISENPEKLRFHDQDALNAILHDQWLILHPRWNAQGYIMNQDVVHPLAQGEREYEETRKHPSIIHYSGHVKPWDQDFDCFTQKYYKKYAEETAFQYLENQRSLPND